MFVTKVPIENKKNVEIKCREIREVDETFRFNFKEKSYGWLLIVSSRTKDQAFQRGEWLINKCDPIKAQDTYYWVHEVGK
ncbi:hypothetical protein AKJ58_00160 [candidate division MSBL1 archaeon SCGC-AAA385D11]|uniref:Uncharacterized protein n=1 Tax=candidate division MSBL1 archaeon SCGC-AAA385D11 TaxID=1698286 RepID=A0A133VPH8_9EURY|nr:hypothetical protein AKJ58_00160 [candidate division MSBL1 archaeon SCGC-AAA385D11]